ncbi:hypothetical protein CPB84DRAFT_1449062 [Gymnopilus junonius]|uniref:DUF6534 domain-containing protein n=1 Tax=Gymnopilus junonius TaxID=109634 RepID=A0A9P5NJP8_GYMJU|nr:hypothetical protein CPB84DRAFT_1449062 [Gymnopilus junonius]
MPALDGTLGAAYLGVLFGAILYGITSVQTFLYFHDSRDDGRLLKLVVLFLWLLDTIHLALICHGLYFYMVTNFGDFAVLASPTWTLIAQVYLTTISDLIVRGFFCRRVFILCSRRKVLAWVLPTIIIMLSLTVAACGCGFASRSFVLKTYKKMSEAAAMLYVSLGLAVAAGGIIAASLCTLLLQSRTGFKRTDSILSFLMAFSINTGLLTSVCAIACFVTYALWPQRFIFMGIYFALSKLYVNALLASLNTRSSLRNQSYGMSTISQSVSMPIAFPTSHNTIATSSIVSESKSYSNREGS